MPAVSQRRSETYVTQGLRSEKENELSGDEQHEGSDEEY